MHVETYADKLKICAEFECTMAQLNQQYEANAKALHHTAKAARNRSGRKHMGKTAREWEDLAHLYQRRADIGPDTTEPLT